MYYSLVSPSAFPLTLITPWISDTDQLHISASIVYLEEEEKLNCKQHKQAKLWLGYILLQK